MYYWLHPEFLPRWTTSERPPGKSRRRRAGGETARARRAIAENWHEADERLADRLTQALLRAPGLTGGRIHMCVQNGVVVLDGEVASEDVRMAVTARVWAEPGVHDVCDMLLIAGAGPE
jgi:osmotically-inducible protein OsmY